MAENASKSQIRQGARRRVMRLVRTSRMRFQKILPLLRVRAAEASGRDVVMLSALGRELRTFDQKVAHIAELAGVRERTIYRWLRRFETEGIGGLRDKPRRDRGTSRRFEKRPAAFAFVVVQAIEGQTAAFIHGRLRVLWPRLYPGTRPPSYSSVAELMKSIAPLRQSPKPSKRSVREGAR